MSTRETILAAFATTLASVASGRVYRSRKEQLPTLPAVIITPDNATSVESVLGMMDHELSVSVSVYAKGDTPDNAADATLAALHTALTAAPTLGLGNDVQLLPGVECEWDFEDYDYVRATHRYHVTYRTATGAF